MKTIFRTSHPSSEVSFLLWVSLRIVLICLLILGYSFLCKALLLV